MRKSKAEKEIDARITRAYGRACDGVQIPILDIPKVWTIARRSVAAGVTDATLEADIADFVESIRVN